MAKQFSLRWLPAQALCTLVYVGALMLGAPLAHARIGDTISDLESRLEQVGRGREYSRDVAPSRYRRLPIDDLLNLVPEDRDINLEKRVYFKHASTDSARSSEMEEGPKSGWDLIVLYYNGRSVVEVYRRLGPRITEPETTALLVLFQDGSVWEKVQRHPESQSEPPPILRANYWRKDGNLAAFQQGNDMVFYDPTFERFFRPIAEQAKKDQAEEEALNAPDSVHGF